jgi:dihydroorotase
MDWILPAADDFHVHLRNDSRTPTAIAATRSGGSARVLAMPNIEPPIRNHEDAFAYLDRLRELGADFAIVPCLKITATSQPETLLAAGRAGIPVAKQYPLGVTTNSEDGVTSTRQLFPLYEAMQELDMVLSLHGEKPGAFVLDAEEEFLPDLVAIHRAFPKLRIVLEHVSSAAACQCVKDLGTTVAATITDHHLELTLNEVVGSRLRPHNFCMPVAKRPSDRAALIQCVAEGHPRFFSGSDSAPHLRQDKECGSGCAGIFSAPFHLPFLAWRFSQWGIAHRLQPFTSSFGREFYRLPENGHRVRLIQEPCTIPAQIDGIVPFLAGHTLPYRLEWEEAS